MKYQFVPTSRVRFFIVVSLLVIPLAMVRGDWAGDRSVVLLWGFLDVAPHGVDAPVRVFPIWRVFAEQPGGITGRPGSISAWPLALGFHLLAAASAGLGLFGREDRRVTGGLLVLASLASLWAAGGIAVRYGVGHTSAWGTVLPVGGILTVAVALVVYGRDLRTMGTPK